MLDLESAPAHDACDAPIVVLVDDDDADVVAALRLHGVEETAELVCATDRRDDEVERRKLPRHGP